MYFLSTRAYYGSGSQPGDREPKGGRVEDRGRGGGGVAAGNTACPGKARDGDNTSSGGNSAADMRLGFIIAAQ